MILVTILTKGFLKIPYKIQKNCINFLKKPYENYYWFSEIVIILVITTPTNN